MTFAELTAAILAWTNNHECEQQIPLFVSMAEAEMQRRLKVRRMIGRSTATINEKVELVPPDFAGVRSFEVSATPPYALEFISADMMAGLEASHPSGPPKFYTLIGDEFRFLPTPSENHTGALTYWRKIPALNASMTSNWLLQDHPDAYLFGCLVQAASFLGDARLSVWKAQFDNALEAIKRADRTESHGGPMQTRSGLCA